MANQAQLKAEVQKVSIQRAKLAGSNRFDVVTFLSRYDALLNDIIDCLGSGSSTLEDVLTEGNATGANSISIDSGQTIEFNVGSGGQLNSATTAAARTWNLPDKSGTVAMLSDIPALDGNGMFDSGNQNTSWAVTQYNLGGSTTVTMGTNLLAYNSTTQGGLFQIDASADQITLGADIVTLGNSGSPTSRFNLNNAGSGRPFVLGPSSGSFNTLTITLGTPGSLTTFVTTGAAFSMNRNLRLDTSGSRSALYVNNGGNGLAISGTNSTAPDIEIDNSGNIGFFATTPAGQQDITGSRGGNVALANLLTGLATLGLITDSTT